MKKYIKLNMNQTDGDGRTILHLAMNNSLASIDASFETLRYLLDQKLNYNAVDDDGRTPLHYAFVKAGEGQSDDTKRDPIEIVSNMLAINDLELNKQDKYEKTPLHYACQHGASISALYMIQRGADFKLKDIFGNSPLGISLLHN